MIAANREDGRVVGGDLNAKDSQGRSLLMVAVLAKNSAALGEILREGRLPVVDVNAKDGFGKTALDHARELLADGEEAVKKITAYATHRSIRLDAPHLAVGRTAKVAEGSPGFATARLDEFEARLRREEVTRAVAVPSVATAAASVDSVAVLAQQAADFDAAVPADGNNDLPLDDAGRAALFPGEAAAHNPATIGAADFDPDAYVPADGDNELSLTEEGRAALFAASSDVLTPGKSPSVVSGGTAAAPRLAQHSS